MNKLDQAKFIIDQDYEGFLGHLWKNITAQNKVDRNLVLKSVQSL